MMDRLCEKLCDILNEQDFCFDPEEWAILRKSLARFKAYEDTGLTPEEVAMKRDALEEYHREMYPLLKAKAEGRLVVLPCRVGDEIYRIVKPSGVCKPFIPIIPDTVEPFGICYRNVMGGYSLIPFDEIGKTVFLTREEAEAALKGGEADG